MASNGNDKNSKTAFIRLRAVDDNYPLYGSITTSHPNRLKLFYTEDNQVLINENLSRNLNVKAGDTILLRNHQFIVNSVIQDIPDIGGAGIFGDLALINQEGLNLLEIKSSENFLEYEYRVKFSDDLEVKNARNSLKEILIDIPGTRLRFPDNTSNFRQRTLDNFSNFLSLISLTAMLISGIGIANTIIAFINQNQTSIAVQKSLGLTSRMIQLIYGYQILFLTFILCIIAFLMSGMFPHFINPFLPTSLGLNLQAVFNLGIFVRVSLITILAISIFLIPALNAIHKLSANSLFRNSFEFVNFNLTKNQEYAISTPLVRIEKIHKNAIKSTKQEIPKFTTPRIDSFMRLKIAPSKISILEKCPRRYWFETKGGVSSMPVIPTENTSNSEGLPRGIDAALFGTIVHRIIEIGIGNPGPAGKEPTTP